MGSEEEQFATIVGKFLSTNNEIRSQAEASYDGIPADRKVFFLLAIIRNVGVPEDLRSLCTVLLRRLLTTHFEFVWNALTPEAQAQVKAETIALLGRETEDSHMRKKLTELAAELVRNLIDDDGNNTWPDFVQFLFTLANNPSVALKENALLVFSLVPGIFGNQQTNYLDLIKQMFANTFQCENESVRFHAGKAFACFITDHEKDDNVIKHFSELMPFFLQAMEESANECDDDELLKLAIDIVGTSPKAMRPYLGQFLTLCLKIARNESTDEEWKCLALECAISAAESTPGAVKKVGAELLPHYVHLMLEMMTSLDDEFEWEKSDEPVEEDSDAEATTAESSLDRFACALGGKTILPIVMTQVHTMLMSPQWEQRYAGLMAVSAVGEGCSKQMEPLLPQIVDPILGFLRDPHPRVRYAACNAIGQMATDFAPNYEKKFHSKILPGLISLLEDSSCPRVQAHAGAALVNFCEECPRDILKNYAEALLGNLQTCFNQKLKELVEQSKKLVLEQLVTTVASVANTLEDDFLPYYDRFMPCMLYIMQNANAAELRLLRGKTIECASLIGLAVGGDKFIEDAAGIMDLLLRTQVDNGGIELADDDPQLSYMITAWARICQILGERFSPYLPMVMTPVLRTAAIKPELAMLDSDEVRDVDDAKDWEVISLGDSQNIGLHTAKLEDKAMACQMLVCYARVMKNHFRPYVDEVVKLVVPLLKFYFHDGVRSSSAEIVPHLLRCVDDNPQDKVMLWNMLKNDLLIATDAEPESDVKCDQLFAIASSVELVPPEALDTETIKKITSVVEKVFSEHFERSLERAEQRKDEDYDEVLEQQLWDEMEDDNYVLTKAADVIHSLLKVHGANYLPYMEPSILQLVNKLIAPDRYWQERQWGLCIWDDVMEFTGPACVNYQNQFIPQLLNYVADASPEVRQAASYGCGVMAQFGQEAFSPACKEALPRLVQIVSNPEARGETNITATENAISAVAKIIKFCPSAVNLEEVVPIWISWLPIWEDKDEMDSVYGLLCDLVESDNPLALGPQGSNLPRIILVIAETFVRKALPDDSVCRPRLVNIVRMVMNNPTISQHCTAVLNPEQLAALQAAVA
ncbi:unnamed protein product [Orchesella dallaii]|uniref:IPO4/5-like TPR repeats domain-containing protein n=1 Tax=Orchesella dallaii TaxID=48710 RepID=A0ABP1REN4_9HEXA